MPKDFIVLLKIVSNRNILQRNIAVLEQLAELLFSLAAKTRHDSVNETVYSIYCGEYGEFISLFQRFITIHGASVENSWTDVINLINFLRLAKVPWEEIRSRVINKFCSSISSSTFGISSFHHPPFHLIYPYNSSNKNSST